MKFPWVSRELYAVVQGDLAHERQWRRFEQDAMAAARERLELRCAALTDELIRMKKAGYEPTPKDPPPDPGLLLPPEVEAAIEARSLNPDMRRQLTRFAVEALRRPEAEAPAIAAEILAGEDVEDLTL